MESEQISFDTIVKTEAEQLRDAVQGSISDKEQYGNFIEVVQNKSYIAKSGAKEAKQAILSYKTLVKGDHYTLLEVNLETGRHHQIRCQLAAIGCPIKGDLKYGAKRSNPDGGICLHARQIEFIHPVSKQDICITAPVPNDSLWQQFAALVH